MIIVRRAASNCGNMAEFRNQHFDNQPYAYVYVYVYVYVHVYVYVYMNLHMHMNM